MAEDRAHQHNRVHSQHDDAPTQVDLAAADPPTEVGPNPSVSVSPPGPPSAEPRPRSTGSASVSPLADTTLCRRYRLERLIGSGGMAQVWEATDCVLDRKVAVKVLHPHLAADQGLVARFRQEAIAAAKLSHPGIVSVYDTCSDGHHEAIVMELLDASTLRQHLTEHGPLDAETTVRLGLRLLDALEAAHRAGLVHRDIKPSNILLSRDGRVRIADFGIAKADDQTELTQEGTLVGTAAYLAPEQLENHAVDGRTDLYSLGIVLYECVTGQTPFTGETRAAVALARLHVDPVDPRHLRADVPAGLSNVLLRTLQRDPDDRYPSVADLRAALLNLDGASLPAAPVEIVEIPEEEPEEDADSFARSERGWLLPALFILLIAAALSIAGLLLRESAISPFSGPDSTDAPTVEATAQPLEGAFAFDPHGGDGENDSQTANAIDGDLETSWRTSGYNEATFFGSKTGVGLAVSLAGPTRVERIDIDGSYNGWDASVFVLDSAALEADSPEQALEFLEPEDLEPTVQVTDVRGSQSLAIPQSEESVGDLIVVWITNLGDVDPDDGRHRVHLKEIAVSGTTVPS